MCRATKLEKQRVFPGDGLVASPIVSLTHAITIEAGVAQVWPWLVQMGAGRAGWYSYDRLDNRGIPSAWGIKPELQNLSVGDLMPAVPGAQDAFVVIELMPYSCLVLGVLAISNSDAPIKSALFSNKTFRASWVFVLEGSSNHYTRLLVRARLGYLPFGLPKMIVQFIAGPIHFIMQQKQLTGIKHRAEQKTESKLHMVAT